MSDLIDAGIKGCSEIRSGARMSDDAQSLTVGPLDDGAGQSRGEAPTN